MGLLSIFKRDRSDAPAPSSEPTDTVQQARTRARRRLMGASLLVLMGIVGFPLLFESQPRPISVDIPIEIPRPEGAPALKIPPARSQIIVVEPPALASEAAKPASEKAASKDDTADTASAKPSVTPPAKPATPASASGTSSSAVKTPAPAAAASTPQKATASKSTPPSEPQPPARASAGDAARAQAALEGRDAPASKTADGAGRFVVQVGAFADAAAAKEVRQKIEKLGLKTYVQTVDTSSGRRTRVRVGPLESKDQANKAAERLKAAGLAAVVLNL